MTDIKDQAIVFQCDYVDRPAGSDPKALPTYTEEQRRLVPEFQDIHIENVTCRGAHTAVKADGILGVNCIHDITIKDSQFIYDKTGNAIDTNTADIRLDNVKFIPNVNTK